MRNFEAFHHPGAIVGIRVWCFQIDWRPDGWLPLNVRPGVVQRGWVVIRIGKGCITAGSGS